MKQRIKLTESDLHRIIKESVKQCLTELNWKTGVEAARAAEKKNDPRKEKFLKYATDRIKSQYPNRNDFEENEQYRSEAHINPYLATKYGYLNYNDSLQSYEFPGWSESDYHKSFGDRGVKGYGNYYLDGKRINWPCKDGVDDNPPGFYNSDSDWDNLSKDMEDYYTGKSHYEKGKGWQ